MEGAHPLRGDSRAADGTPPGPASNFTVSEQAVIGLPIAIQTKCLAQPLRQALHTASRLGCQGVQIDLRQELPAADLSSTALRHIRKLLEDLNLRVGSTAFPTRRGYAEADDLERRLEATINSMHAASRLQSRVLLIALGSLPLPDDPHRATLVEALLALASQGNRLGVQLALQAPAVRPADVNALLNELPEGLIGVDLSPADLILHSQSPAAYAADVGPRVLHVFANDAVRGLGGPGGGDVVLGRGSADLPELLSVLEEREYRGWITIERRASREPVEDASNAVQFLRSL